MKYQLVRCFKTKDRVIFETDKAENIKLLCEKMDLREFSKPYIYSSIRCEDMYGKQYAIKQFVEINGGHIIVSPDNVAKLFNL